MRYPSSLKFTELKNGVKVERVKQSKYNSVIWAMSYLLNESAFRGSAVKIIDLGEVKDPTDTLRLFFLPRIFKGFTFYPDVTEQAESIIKKINNKEYITYGKNYDLKKRGTKNKQESLLEEYISNNLPCLSHQFNKDSIAIRQFPANFFNGSISELNRAGDKFWIDILSVNKLNQLSVVELKAGHNVPLDLFIQAIDYGIFAYLFREWIAGTHNIKNRNIIGNKVAVYLVAEKFHPAIVGDKKTYGVCSCLQRNIFFDIHLIQFEKDGHVLENAKEMACI